MSYSSMTYLSLKFQIFLLLGLAVTFGTPFVLIGPTPSQIRACQTAFASPIGRKGVATTLYSSSLNAFEVVKSKVLSAEPDVNRWLVRQGFEFDSYRRRFDLSDKDGDLMLLWVRSRSEGVMEYLQAHGLSSDEAKKQVERPYTQQFVRESITSEGIVYRVIVDGGRRNTVYELGEWIEKVPENFNSAMLFTDGSQLRRRTYWDGIRHITETKTTVDGGSSDTTIRYIGGDGNMIVERIYQRTGVEPISCKEYFAPQYSDDSLNVIQSSLQRVPGCVANVDIRTTLIASHGDDDYQVYLDGEADAMISRGMLAVLSKVLSQMSAKEVLLLDPTKVTDQLGLRTVLSTGRNDGLASMTKTIQTQIKAMLCNGQDQPSSINVNEESKGTQPTVAMLLSGGVDSSVALNLLTSQGYNVTAFYLKIWLEDELAHLGQCPWEDDYKVCEEVCAQAGVPLESISLQEQYKEKVISYTVREAERGRTPNPDIMCNSRVKFGCFYDAIDERGFDYVASGHYAQLVLDKDTDRKKLMRAPDPVKDQSYFLCALTQEQLRKVIFPIGHLQKAKVRELAEEFDLPNKKRPDSQGLCFLGKVKFDEFLRAYLGERPGDIVDAATGEVLGRHHGVWYHTVGQRKGIGKVLDPKATSRGPWYVVSKDPSKNIVSVSNEYDEEIFEAARTSVYVEDIHWIGSSPPVTLISEDGSFYPGRFAMKIRHGPKLVEGSLFLQEMDSGHVVLDTKDGGLAPGQFVVFYDVANPECLGGGIISERHWAELQTENNAEASTAASR